MKMHKIEKYERKKKRKNQIEQQNQPKEKLDEITINNKIPPKKKKGK